MSLKTDCRKYCLTHGLLSCHAVIVGVSGGADSMCLLDILYSLSRESVSREFVPRKFARESVSRESESREFVREEPETFPVIIVAHINHGLRGSAAEKDEEMVRKYCQARGIGFFSKREDIAGLAKEMKISIEQAGRFARYAFFRETEQNNVPEGGLVYTAVAHHREDQAETILMNLFRGAGPEGLCGMKTKSSNIIRPLLFASKDDILSYLQSAGVPYSEDLTNLDNTYTRNRWRNQILPLIAEVSRKDPVQPLLSFAELAGTDKEYFEEKIIDIYEKSVYRGGSGSYGLPCSVIRNEHKSISSRLVRYLYTARFCSGTDLTSVHVTAIISLVSAGSNGHRVSLPDDRIAYIAEDALFFDELSDVEQAGDAAWRTKQGRIFLCSEEKRGEAFLALKDLVCEGAAVISKTSFEVEAILVENPEQVVYNGQTWYCPGKFFPDAVFRTRRQGDWFSRSGSCGGKPLRRYLTDRKIPLFLRDRMILVASGSQVLWIPGVSHAEGFTDEASGCGYFGASGLTMNESSVQNMQLYRITIRDTNEQEEH